MRNFANIQAQMLEDDLGVDGESTRAKLETWITFLFENQDTVSQMRSDPLEMQGGGESAGSTADDDDAAIHFRIFKRRHPTRFQSDARHALLLYKRLCR